MTLTEFNPIRPLWKHQKATLEMAKDKRDFAIFFQPGVGKTLTSIALSRYKMHQASKSMRVLVLAPPIVVENWKKEWKMASLTPDEQILALTGDSKKKSRLLYNAYEEKKVVITNYESILNKDVFAGLSVFRPEIIIFDECFVAGTLVDTPDGKRAIETLKVGDRVNNCNGEGVIRTVMRRHKIGYVNLSFGTSKVKCSLNHPWLTTRGWVSAQNLKEGDLLVKTSTAMRIVQEGNSKNKTDTFLQHILLSEMEDESARNSRRCVSSGSLSENQQGSYGQEESENFRVQEDSQPHVFGRKSYKGSQQTSCYVSQTFSTWRQRSRPNNPRTDPHEFIAGKVSVELLNSYFRKARVWFSECIQNRFGISIREIGNRSRWPFSQRFIEKIPGQKEIGLADFERVDCVEIQKSGNIGRPEKTTFYDLEVSGHPSFSVEGVLVHNCHRLKNYQAKRTKQAQLLAQLPSVKHRFILSGTPVLNTMMDLFSQFRVMDLGETFGQNFFTFRAKYFYDKNAGMPPQHHFPNWCVRPGAVDEITAKIRAKALFMEKSQCLDLPPFIKETIYVELSSLQKRLYQSMVNDFIAFYDNKVCSANMALTKMLRLMQIVSGFVAVEDEEGKNKNETVIEDNPRASATRDLLEELTPSGKVIIWASFRQNYETLRNICKELGLKYVEIHGEIAEKDRFKAVESFNNDPSTKVCIGNAGSGGIGINLVAAPYSIFYSRNFSLEHDIQAEARNYRGGSEIHTKITRYDLVAKDTIDEQILTQLSNKQEISDKVLNELILELKNGNKRSRRAG